jgi:hypothetical protein
MIRSIDYFYQAIGILGYELQLLATNSLATSTTARTILSFGIIFELLGLILLICIHIPRHTEGIPLSLRLVLRVPTIMILIGMLGLATTVVVENVKMSLSASIGMSCTFVLGGTVCLVTLWLTTRGRP